VFKDTLHNSDFNVQGSVGKELLTLMSGFRRHVDEFCDLLGYYAASCDNCLVNNYRTTPHNIPEERRSKGIISL
jgi:hypothetical protein